MDGTSLIMLLLWHPLVSLIWNCTLLGKVVGRRHGRIVFFVCRFA